MQINNVINLGFSAAGQAASPNAGLSTEPSALANALSSFAGAIGLPKEVDSLLQINDPQGGGNITIPQINAVATPLLSQIYAQQYIDISADKPIDQNILQNVFNQSSNTTTSLADAYNLSAIDLSESVLPANELSNADDEDFAKQLAQLQDDAAYDKANLQQLSSAAKTTEIASLTAVENVSAEDLQAAQDLIKNHPSALDKNSKYHEKKDEAKDFASLDFIQQDAEAEIPANAASYLQLKKANEEIGSDFKNFNDRPIDVNELRVGSKLADAVHSKLEAQFKHIENEQLLKTPIEQIKVKISQGIELGQDKISIKLHPHELGKVDVHMDTDKDGKTQIRIVADKSETLDFLRRDSGDLQRSLKELGVNSDAANMQFSLNQNQNNNNQNAFNNDSNDNGAKISSQKYSNYVPPSEIELSYAISSQGGLNIVV